MKSRSGSILRFWLMSSLVLLASAGCGGRDVGQVEGTITLDGKPLAEASVTFTPLNATGGESLASSGVTDNNGKYSLSLVIDEDSGAVIGKHKIVIAKIFESESDVMTDQEMQNANLPFHDFTFEVKSGSNEANFNLESKKKGKK